MQTDVADITVRPLAAGEEVAWAALSDQPVSDVREAADLASRRTGPHAEGEHCALVAIRDGRIVGRLRGLEPDRQTFVVTSAAVRDATTAHSVIATMLAYVVRTIRDRRIEALSWQRPDQEVWHQSLLCAGFELYMEKTYYRRKLSEYCSPYVDRLEYRSLAEQGERVFVEALAIASEGSVDRAIHPGDAAGDLASYREFAGSAFDPTHWLIARQAGELVGIVCPQRFHDVPHEGSIFALAVAPGFRGRGWGRVLHARGLETLARTGATDYVGSTDVRNAAMARVFTANGCQATGERRYYEMREAGT